MRRMRTQKTMSKYQRPDVWVYLPKRGNQSDRARLRRLMRSYKPAARRQMGARAYLAPAREYPHRGIVQASYKRNGPAANWARIGAYIERGAAQPDGQKAPGFDGQRSDIDIASTAAGWQAAGDAMVWKLIVSPENARGMDLQEHVRDLLAAMESDLGTRLEWAGVIHHNTDHQHAHVIVRGVDQDGRRLEIDPEYIRRGLHERQGELLNRDREMEMQR
jgi:type IV secretory pathway VirD2 relaxase